LYATLLATLPKRHQPAGYVLSPMQALAIPSASEISSRWPGMSAEEVEAMTEGYQAESSRLAEYDLRDAAERARELVLEQFMS